ncbi:MAG TPA: DUF5611 family protein [Methanoregulaceae archaeon]|nr:DUF5611 family protein [Methanoregulaceae archaeon]HOV67470.1 DUF5611 family protein [Methanoregulaceae archaeon]HQJ88185.1 DUF5611 family protein [Methanoregulaceae archaeon]
MEEFEVKRGFTKELATRIPIELRRCFGCEPEPVGDGYAIAYGAIRRLIASPGSAGKTLLLAIESDTGIDDDAVILETIRRRNAFLEAVTGFNAKERVKRAKKKAEG